MADYENFVRALLPRLLRYATMLTGERELAADLVQDVLVKAYRRWARISGTDHPDRYVLRMVTNGYPGPARAGHETRYADEDGYLRLFVLDAVRGAPVAVAGSVPLTDLYDIANRLVLPS